MAGLSKLFSQHREVLSFAIVGISSSAVYILTVAILSIYFQLGNTPSIMIAYAVGTVVSYIGSGVFAFRKTMTGANLTRFLIVVGISFLMNVIISEVLSLFGVQAVVIGVVNVCVVGVFNFLSHKLWTFK